jgi:hypothetical protein
MRRHPVGRGRPGDRSGDPRHRDVPIPRRPFPASLSAADLAYLRFAESGELPARVKPQDYVELVETEPRRDRPEPASSQAQAQATQPGAA